MQSRRRFIFRLEKQRERKLKRVYYSISVSFKYLSYTDPVHQLGSGAERAGVQWGRRSKYIIITLRYRKYLPEPHASALGGIQSMLCAWTAAPLIWPPAQAP
ncbi:hypothetical protein J6590_014182 [Homalodisca vitripennis]|nr:hypothetical protein J6590_014182 [Homalodisca vitripennis]